MVTRRSRLRRNPSSAKLRLHNEISGKIGLSTDAEILLFDHLLWLRNHYDYGDPQLKDVVLGEVDDLLDSLSGSTGQ